MKIILSPSQHLLDVSKRWRTESKPIRREDQARADALSVALAQPHRRGSYDPRLESPLGRFCASRGLSGHLYGAGTDYRNVVLEARQAMGLTNAGWSPGSSGYKVEDDEKIKKRVRDTRDRQDRADATLKRIHLRLPSAMRDMCVLEIEHNQEDSAILQAGLVALDALFSSVRKKPK
jgi:hypothetical protein